MKNKRCNKWYILIVCIGISLIVIYFIRNENEKRVITAMFVEIEDNDKNPVYYKEIAENNIELNLTLQYSSNKEQEIQVYLLHNFSLTSFSINGKESMRHSVNITPSKYLKSSKDNVLTLSDVSFDKNEFCLLIIGETHITTKRFQIDNVNGEKNRKKMEEVNNELLYPKLYKHDLIDLPIYTTNEIPHIDVPKESTELNSAEGMYVVCNYNKLVEKNIKNEKEHEYIVLPLFMKEDLDVGKPISIQMKETNFFFDASCFLKEDYDELRIIIFPYPYEFTKDFLGTFKAELWSNLLITHEIRKDI